MARATDSFTSMSRDRVLIKFLVNTRISVERPTGLVITGNPYGAGELPAPDARSRRDSPGRSFGDDRHRRVPPREALGRVSQRRGDSHRGGRRAPGVHRGDGWVSDRGGPVRLLDGGPEQGGHGGHPRISLSSDREPRRPPHRRELLW